MTSEQRHEVAEEVSYEVIWRTGTPGVRKSHFKALQQGTALRLVREWKSEGKSRWGRYQKGSGWGRADQVGPCGHCKDFLF